MDEPDQNPKKSNPWKLTALLLVAFGAGAASFFNAGSVGVGIGAKAGCIDKSWDEIASADSGLHALVRIIAASDCKQDAKPARKKSGQAVERKRTVKGASVRPSKSIPSVTRKRQVAASELPGGRMRLRPAIMPPLPIKQMPNAMPGRCGTAKFYAVIDDVPVCVDARNRETSDAESWISFEAKE